MSEWFGRLHLVFEFEFESGKWDVQGKARQGGADGSEEAWARIALGTRLRFHLHLGASERCELA